MEKRIPWSGVGRWMSFLGGGLLTLSAVPLILSNAQQASEGWSIFLGLLLIGSVAAESKIAPNIAIGIAAVLFLRVILVPVLGAEPFDFVYSLVPAVLVAWAAIDLRSQAALN